MSRWYRFSLFLLSTTLLVVISTSITGSITVLLSQFWFASGILLVVLLSLIDQPHFSRDTNIFGNAITAAISLILVPEKDHDWIYWVFYVLSFYLIISSYALFWLRQKTLEDEHPVIQFVSRLNREIGKPETLFSALFLWGAITQFGLTSYQIIPLFWFWLAFIILNIPQVAQFLEELLSAKVGRSPEETILGTIFGVQSKNTFLVKLLPIGKRPSLRLFDFVEFRFSVEERERVRRGLVFETYWLNEEQWIKVLTNREIERVLESLPRAERLVLDTVYKITPDNTEEFFNRFIGIVTEDSSIHRLYFFYNSKRKISEGQLLEVMVNGQQVLYQVIDGSTKVDQLERKNQSGYIIGEAFQLGTWNHESCQFEPFGWLPEINTPVYVASSPLDSRSEASEITVGTIPGTQYPVILDRETAITHHMAVLGVTGTGKSVFCRDLIRKHLLDPNVKVIVVDFTGEYKNKFDDQVTSTVIGSEDEERIFQNFEFINNELEKFGNQQNKDGIKQSNKTISDILQVGLKRFLSDPTQRISIVELPEVSNTTNVLEYTKSLFKELFKLARAKSIEGRRVCIVLEEAHTVVPEWSFVGDSGKVSQSVLNSIAQIALQGRKYNIGLLVIAQRTANVSKTILTQCNSIVSFQVYDRTSIDFLANYYGSKLAETLPNLRFRQAIASGKAFKSNVPMIFEVPEIVESAKEIGHGELVKKDEQTL